MKSFNKIKQRDDFFQKVHEHTEDEFDQIARQGWNENGSNPEELLRKTDKRFIRSKKAALLFGLLFIAVVGFFFIVKTHIKDHQDLMASKGKTVKQEQKKLPLEEKIAEIKVAKEISKQKQIKTTALKKDFKEKMEIRYNKESEESFSKLESKKINSIESKQNSGIIKLKGKELYLYDLLCLDYRSYRSSKTFKDKKQVLSGTTADKEDENSEGQNPDVDAVTVDVPYTEYLDKSMYLFSKGEFKEALIRFVKILGTYPNDLNANFYGGLCYYNIGQYQDAKKLFKQTHLAEFSNFSEESNWYLAKTEIASNNKEEAKNILRKIIDEKGFYTTQAKSELQKLN